MTMNIPWYKHFWPWFLITVPVITVIVSGVLVYFATSTEDTLVIDDYYKEGKAINARLDKVERARYLKITTDLSIDDKHVAVTFHSGIPAEGTALKMAFYHVTLASRDTELLLTRDASGIYRGTASASLDGKWQVSLMPMDDNWKIQNTLELPRSDVISFNP